MISMILKNSATHYPYSMAPSGKEKTGKKKKKGTVFQVGSDCDHSIDTTNAKIDNDSTSPAIFQLFFRKLTKRDIQTANRHVGGERKLDVEKKKTVVVASEKLIEGEKLGNDELRKYMIIHNGIRRKIFCTQQSQDPWPVKTDVLCHYCCHAFDTCPIGIPNAYISGTQRFVCSGNFCTFSCAKRYLFPSNTCKDDKMLSSVVPGDLVVTTDNPSLVEQGQLLQLMYQLVFAEELKKQEEEKHREGGGGVLQHVIPLAPQRLVLKAFGGALTIEEFRAAALQPKNFNIFQAPMAPNGMHIEQQVDLTSTYKKTLQSEKLSQTKVALFTWLDHHGIGRFRHRT